MKLKTTLLAMAVLSTQAMAGELNLDARFDNVSYTGNDAAATPSYNAFQVSRLKLDYSGKFEDKHSYRVRFDFLSGPSSTTTTRDKTGKMVDFAFLSTKLTDDLSLTFGKLITGMGGIEGSTNPGDFYLRSAAGNEVADIYWPTGAQLDWKMDDHRVRVTVANNTEDVTSSSKLNQTRNMAGIIYTDKFMDGMLMPNLSYYSEKYSNGGVDKTNSYAAAGVKVKWQSMEFDVDYLQNKYSPDPQAANNTLDTQSGIVLARYFFTPENSLHAKYENSTKKIATSATADKKQTITGLTAAYEQRFSSEKNFRWHVAYTQKDTKEDNIDTKTDKTVYVGVRILADVLK